MFLIKVLTTGRICDLGQQYESGSQTRKRKERQNYEKLKASVCKEINRFSCNANEQLADPTSI